MIINLLYLKIYLLFINLLCFILNVYIFVATSGQYGHLRDVC